MPKHSFQSTPAAAGDLDAHLTGFLEVLADAGYAEKTRHDKQRLLGQFIRWVCRSSIRTEDIDESSIEAFLSCPSRRRYNQRSALQMFVGYLRLVEAVPPRHCELSCAEHLVRRYVEHLRDKQGLSPHSIAAYSPFACAFVDAQCLPENLLALDRLAVTRYQVEHSRKRSASYVKLLAAALRSFLRFCFLDGTTAADLSAAVQPVRRWQLTALPPFLTTDQLEHVIAVAAIDRSTARGCRTFAIVLLLARLGLRASEVLALRLDDIHWDVGEIVVRGKGRLQHRLPLPYDVGEALALYLRDARGPSTSRCVFVRAKAPHVGLSEPSSVSSIARQAMQRAGVLPNGRAGAHVFRHSLATRMIRSGASLPEIAQVLGHRSMATTQLYAKVEFDALRDVASAWPSVEAPR